MTDPPPGRLSPEEEHLLLEMARRTVQAAIAGGEPPPRPDGLALFHARRDVFVTLRLEGALRGCLGTYGAARPLFDNLVQAALGAARDDPRFPPLRPDELRRVRIEVTLLDPPFPVSGPEAIAVGRHGLSVSHREARGLLLPQVAIEHRLDAVSFLGLACRKAGLAPDAWKRGARVEAFTAECVAEPETDPGTDPGTSSRGD